MFRTMMRAKLHQATVTDADVTYEGSITIDQALMEAIDIVPNEQVHVWNVTNGERFITYAIPDRPGSRTICVNGSAARLVTTGDRLIIASFVQCPMDEARGWEPKKLFLDEENNIVKCSRGTAVSF